MCIGFSFVHFESSLSRALLILIGGLSQIAACERSAESSSATTVASVIGDPSSREIPEAQPVPSAVGVDEPSPAEDPLFAQAKTLPPPRPGEAEFSASVLRRRILDVWQREQPGAEISAVLPCDWPPQTHCVEVLSFHVETPPRARSLPRLGSPMARLQVALPSGVIGVDALTAEQLTSLRVDLSPQQMVPAGAEQALIDAVMDERRWQDVHESLAPYREWLHRPGLGRAIGALHPEFVEWLQGSADTAPFGPTHIDPTHEAPWGGGEEPRCSAASANCLPIPYTRHPQMLLGEHLQYRYQYGAARTVVDDHRNAAGEERCKHDGDCVVGGCGNACRAWDSPPQSGICIAYRKLSDALCGCVSGECQWFTQPRRRVAVSIAALRFEHWPREVALVSRREMVESQWFALDRLETCFDTESRVRKSVRVDAPLDEQGRPVSVKAHDVVGAAASCIEKEAMNLDFDSPEFRDAYSTANRIVARVTLRFRVQYLR